MSNAKMMTRRIVVGVLAAALLVCLLVAAMVPLSSYAANPTTDAANPTTSSDFESFDIAVLEDGTQDVWVTFHYDDAVNITGSQNTKVSISGQTVAPTRVTVAADGNDFIVKIAASIGYSTILNGLITVDCDMADVTIGTPGIPATPISSDSATGNFPVSVIPGGTTLSTSGQGTATISVDVLSVPRGNGMIHVGIYYDDQGELVPIWTDTSKRTDPIDVFTYTAFVDSYDPAQPMTEYALAKVIATYVSLDGNFDSSRYTITAGGDPVTGEGTLTVTDSEGENLYILIFDDVLIKALQEAEGDPSITYSSVVAADGVLPLFPY